MTEKNYYYHQMDKRQQRACQAMKAGLLSLAPSFPVPRLEGRELTDVFFQLRLDCPEIFWSSGFRYQFYPDSEHVELIPEYLFPKNKIVEHQRAMEARVKKLAKQAEALDERSKLLYIHDFICQNVHYDKLKKAYSHEIIGPLGQGVGVCEGIAKAVKILCDTLGIWCVIALSEANPEKGIRYRHAWNVVRLNGTYYHLDATFDRSLCREDTIRYDYFLLSDAQIFRDHEPVVWHIPACEDGSRSYYREKKLSFTRYEDVQKRGAQAAKKGRQLIFQWRGGYLTREVVQDLWKMLAEEAAGRGKYAFLSVNWPQAVLQVSFRDTLPTEPIVLEEQNPEEPSPGEENDVG